MRGTRGAALACSFGPIPTVYSGGYQGHNGRISSLFHFQSVPRHFYRLALSRAVSRLGDLITFSKLFREQKGAPVIVEILTNKISLTHLLLNGSDQSKFPAIGRRAEVNVEKLASGVIIGGLCGDCGGGSLNPDRHALLRPFRTKLPSFQEAANDLEACRRLLHVRESCPWNWPP